METIAKLEPKTERLEARLTKSQKKLFARAASLEGFSNVSDYVVQATLKSAQQVIQKNDILVLSEEDRKIFFDALLNPPKPNAALRKAMREFQADKKRNECKPPMKYIF